MTKQSHKIDVSSVSEFLDELKDIYCDDNHQLFYRGVSKIQYAASKNDHPSIYRNKNWIKNEDKMFYELTAKCPEYFKDCKTTFEHLVMMQHYGYPTRLLDITSNPLVALYFACDGASEVNHEDGQVISYHLNDGVIKRYDDKEIFLKCNLVTQPATFDSILIELIKCINNFSFLRNSLEAYGNNMMLSVRIMQQRLLSRIYACITRHKALIVKDISQTSLDGIQGFMDDWFNEDSQARLFNYLHKHYNFYEIFPANQLASVIGDNIEIINSSLKAKDLQSANVQLFNLMMNISDNIVYSTKSPMNSFAESCQRNYYVLHNKNNFMHDIYKTQCVLPKQNNPRLIAQQGAFLLFGFKDAISDKTATPIIPDSMYANSKDEKDQDSGNKVQIIIKGSAKQKILDELKTLGISNSTMFPEIDNIANEIKNQYLKKN